MEGSFARWNVLQPAHPWFRNGTLNRQKRNPNTTVPANGFDGRIAGYRVAV
jgi:hypothetical protein